jgi:predicted LPLAT superfamily acyltransferase
MNLCQSVKSLLAAPRENKITYSYPLMLKTIPDRTNGTPDVHPELSMPKPTHPQSHPSPDEWAEPNIEPAWTHKFFAWLIRYGGKARGYHIAYFASFWYVLFYPSIRRRCRFYLDHRFPNRRRWDQRFMDDFRLIRTFAITMVDMIILKVLGPTAFSAHCPQHDELIQRCAREQGFILLHAHVGCFQIGMSALTRVSNQVSKNVSVFIIPQPGEKMFANIIDPRSGLNGVIQLTDALLRGEVITMMGDRVFGSDHNVTPVQFLGGQTSFPITPYRLASATGVPIVVMTAPRTGKSSYELRVIKVIEVPPKLGRSAADYAPYAQQFAQCIEQFAQEFPWQVYNFYDLWQNKA